MGSSSSDKTRPGGGLMGFIKSLAKAGLLCTSLIVAAIVLLPYQSAQAVDEILNVLSGGPEYNRALSVLHGTNEPVPTEIAEPIDLPVLSGGIPPDVDGVFVRIGPNELTGGNHGRMTYHLFDGHGFVHAVTINGARQAASYARSWLKTPRFVVEREKGRDVFGRMGTLFMPYLPLRLLVQAVKARHFGLAPLTRGSANTDTRLIDGRLYALNEASLPFEFALKPTAPATAGANGGYSVESVGYQNFDGKLDAPVTAHPRRDPQKGSTVFASYSPSQSVFPVGEIEGGNLVSLRRVPGRHPGKIGWAHDAALTENYVVIPDGGTLLDPLSAVKRGVFFDLIGTLGFTVVPRRNDGNGTAAAAAAAATPEAASGEPFAVTSNLSETIVHIATAWETDDSIVVAAPTSATLRGIPVNEDTLKYEHFQFAKLTLPKGPGEMKVERIDYPDCSSEFPRVNPLLDGGGRKVRFAFASCIAKPGDRRVGPANFSGWVKFDLESMRVASYVPLPEGWMIGELVPIPKRGGTTGGDGASSERGGGDGSDEVWLVGVMSHVDTRESRIVLYDGESGSSEPVVVLGVPERIPSGFHGQFYSREELDGQAHFSSSSRGSSATIGGAGGSSGEL